jgi:hypothetical protein
MNLTRSLLVSCAAALACSGVAATLHVQVESTRSVDNVRRQVDEAARRFTANAALLTARERANRGLVGPFTLPVTVRLSTPAGPLPPPSPARGRDAHLTLAFADSGEGAFPLEYRSILEQTFSRARATMDAVFGRPLRPGVVLVRNYDAQIGDRHAIAGGLFLPNNGAGQMEIRFPVYADSFGFKPEVAAVNFVHTLLLAYIADFTLPTDGWQEGLARAAAMRVVRTPGALPATLDPVSVEQVLESSYDIGATYDWCNQPALAGPVFIAPNLRTAELPAGGSVGGLYLLRYQMAGSAFQKVLVEHPGFAARFLAAYAARTPRIRTTDGLNALAQTTLEALAGPGATVEGRRFPDWALRQHVLDGVATAGRKLLVQPFPIVEGLGGNDFGVFGVQAHWFETLVNGDERLLRDVAYPIFWSPDFTRFFPSAQEDRMDIFGAYGSVAPNFLDQFGGQPYRVALDLPVQDRVARVYLPAGAVATAANPVPNDLFGSMTGMEAAATYRITVAGPGGSAATVPVTHGAFGANLGEAFRRAGPVTLTVIRSRAGLDATVLRRRVNKGPGALAVDLHLDAEQVWELPGGLLPGLQMIGPSVRPYRGGPMQMFGLPADRTQVARWDPLRARYEFFPGFGELSLGLGAYVRSDSSRRLTVAGWREARTPLAVALKPGWNQVVSPLGEDVLPSQVLVLTTTSLPLRYADAIGTLLGNEFFQFTRGAPDPVSGFPETGSVIGAAQFRPGQAVWVRCFSPDGATLLFVPPARRTREAPGSGGRAPLWSMRVAVAGGGESARAHVGQARGATPGFDRAWDTELPPAAGALRVSVGPGWYRDMRGPRPSELYTVRLEGLVAGRPYTVRFEPQNGIRPRFMMRDVQGRRVRSFTGAGTYTFTATGPARTLGLTVRRPR